MQARVKAKLATAGIDVDGIEGLQVFQDVPNPFDGFQARHMQEKYYRESLRLVVSNPFPIKYSWDIRFSTHTPPVDDQILIPPPPPFPRTDWKLAP